MIKSSNGDVHWEDSISHVSNGSQQAAGRDS